ncbi:MAG: T9SS type A sorting domain-containing protein [bacterium]
MIKLFSACFVLLVINVFSAVAIDLSDWSDTTDTKLVSVEDSIIPLPSCHGDFKICLAYFDFRICPNPANDILKIDYGVMATGQVDLYLYNLESKRIINLVNKQQTKGRYFLEVDLTDYLMGTYLCVLQSVDYQRADKIIIIR